MGAFLTFTTLPFVVSCLSLKGREANMFFLSKLRTVSTVLNKKPVVQTVRHGGTWYYRRLAGDPPKQVMYKAEFLGFVMWYWILYHLYKEPDHITGHFEYPDPSKWTDEELGIPGDDEE